MVTPLLLAVAMVLLQSQSPASGLRIVVIEGEGAVNIIQQKTAVRPLVEVRDRNDLPVAGAIVTFTIGGGSPSAAFAGGAQTLTVTTNAAGQAAASGFSAINSGAVQIQVQAAYQGQIATAAISQTNFATAAAAQAGASANSATGAATGGASGGGLSGSTIGILGGVAAAGAVAATQLGGDNEADGDADGAPAGGDSRAYRGSISGQMPITIVSTSTVVVSTCVTTYAVNGSIEITFRNGSPASARIEGARTFVSNAPASCPPPPITTLSFVFEGAVTGSAANMSFRDENTYTGPVPDGGTGTGSDTGSFTGALAGDVISGNFTFETRASSQGSTNAQGIPYSAQQQGTVTISVTLR